MFLTHVETVFRGTPYFVAASLFDNLFSRSFKAFHFSAKDLFASFCFTSTIFLNKTSGEKLKASVLYFFLPKNWLKRSNLKTFEFGWNLKAKVRENERVHQFCSTYSRYQESRYREFFCLKKARNVQGTEELVRAIGKFKKLNIRVFESQLYLYVCP